MKIMIRRKPGSRPSAVQLLLHPTIVVLNYFPRISANFW